MKRFFHLSTGSLGGAAIMLFFTVFLGEKAPWFVEKLQVSAGQVYSLTLNVNKIFDHQSSASEIDPEKYYLDGIQSFYLKIPSKDWSVSKYDPGEYLTNLSVADVPILHHVNSIIGMQYQPQRPQKGDVTTTKLSIEGSEHKISFTDKSKFDGVPLRVNLFKDPEFLNMSILVDAKTRGADLSEADELLARKTAEAKNEYQKVKDQYLAEGERIIEDNWPSEKLVQTSVTVTTFRPQLYSNLPIARLLGNRPEESILNLIAYLQYSNPELMSLNIKNAAISKDNRVFLIDATSPLENILVDDKEIEKIYLVKSFLIATANDLIYVVNLEYLNGVGISRQLVHEVEELFLSFRLLTNS